MAETQMSGALPRPDHVPEHLFWDHDIDEFAMELDDPYLAVSRLYDGPELIYARSATRGVPGWIPTRYKLVEEIFTRAEDFSSAQNYAVTQLLEVDWVLNPLEIDPPHHGKFRRVLQPYFQPSVIARLEAKVRQACAELIDRFADKGACEFVGDFSSLLPSYVFLDLMGLPRDMLDQFLAWEHAFMRGPEVIDKVMAARAIKAYLEQAAKERRTAPPQGDLFDVILAGEVDGQPLDHGAIMGMLMTLYLGGLDTVASSLGWHFRHLATHPELQARLRADPSLIPGAVDDLLRAFGVTDTGRTVTRDLEIGGVAMKKGDWVITPTYLASRDPREFANPHEVDPHRKGRHMTLATGVHNCLGIHLAKLELRVALEEWLKRVPQFHIGHNGPVQWHTVAVWGVSRLPLEWQPA